MYDLLIIGGGPAGLTAAMYAIRKRLNCVLVSPDLGGKANARMSGEGLDTFQVIDGADIVRRFRTEIEYLDFARRLEKVISLARDGQTFVATTASGAQLQARAVILATGADAIRLAVPGADRYFLRGVAYSTVSYAPLYIDKTVALIGSGDLALRGAAELSQIVHRLFLVASTLPDDCSNPSQLSTPLGCRLQGNDRVNVLADWQPVSVEGDSFARCLNVRAPDGEEHRLEVDAIFVELGLRPYSALVAGWGVTDEAGRVMVDASAGTAVPGLFAAGDVTTVPVEQVLIAIGEGVKAALSAYEYLLTH